MRLVTYQDASGPRTRLRPRQWLCRSQPRRPYNPHVAQNLVGRRTVDAAPRGCRGRQWPTHGPDGLQLLAPIPDPQKVLCIGLNYADHARESGQAPPSEPVLFCKFPTAVLAPGEPIVLPTVSKEVDYEAELVVVIGQGGRNIPLGRGPPPYRRLLPRARCFGPRLAVAQARRPMAVGQIVRYVCAVRPALVTSDEIDDPGQLRIELRLNGRTMQNSNTRQLIFGVDHLVSYISQVCTLLPGDVIFTGTPPGVGAARKPPVFLQPGDVVEIEIEKLGVLRNPVVAAPA